MARIPCQYKPLTRKISLSQIYPIGPGRLQKGCKRTDSVPYLGPHRPTTEGPKMRNPTDTMELRREFAERFLVSPQDHTEQILDGPMQSLIDEFDEQLCLAKKRWPSINYSAEWVEMDEWLSDHDYVDPHGR
jgi:hypothetical protein